MYRNVVELSSGKKHVQYTQLLQPIWGTRVPFFAVSYRPRSHQPTPIEQRLKLLQPAMASLIAEASQLGIEHSALLDEFATLLDRRQ